MTLPGGQYLDPILIVPILLFLGVVIAVIIRLIIVHSLKKANDEEIKKINRAYYWIFIPILFITIILTAILFIMM